MKIAEKLQALAPYDPMPDIYNMRLDANESYMALPITLKEKVLKAIADVPFNRYPDPTAAELCFAASQYYGVNQDQIVAGNGSDELISILLGTFLEKNDRLMVAVPDFSMYAFYAHLYELEVIDTQKSGLQVDADSMIQSVRESGAKMLLFSNPCNPTGQGICSDDVLQIVKECNCFVVVDEAYMEFWNQSVIHEISNYENLIILRTCSKALGLAGIRLGFAVAEKKIIDEIKKAKSPFNVNALTQAAALQVFKEEGYIRECIQKLIASKNELYQKLSTLCEYFDIIDTKTNFVLVRSARADAIWKELQKEGISVRKIMGDYLRITAGNETENRCVVNTLRTICKGGTTR